jgi:molybdopterin molybdotransferase
MCWYHNGMRYRTQLSVAEAIELVRATAPAPSVERALLREARARILARDLASLVDHPSCDNSALDGYACRREDTLAANPDEPVRLRVVGDVPAGQVFTGSVGRGEAVGIYTGSPVPSGADAIVMVEKTERQGDEVLLFAPASSSDIRPRASDLRRGEVYLRAGTKLNAAALGVAAAMGYAEVPVARRPRFGILSTGNEVLEPGEALREGQVYNANAYSLAALVEEAGGEAVVLPRARDDIDELRALIAQQRGLDMLLTTGGVSMGRYDLVRELLLAEGEVAFWKVAIRPGGPALFGRWRDLSIFGLPGNPVSCMVVFRLIVEPWLARALGDKAPPLYERREQALARSEFKGAGFKEAFRRGVAKREEHGWVVETTGEQGSGILTSMLHANCLVCVPPHRDVRVGEEVEIILLA